MFKNAFLGKIDHRNCHHNKEGIGIMGLSAEVHYAKSVAQHSYPDLYSGENCLFVYSLDRPRRNGQWAG